MLMCVSARLFQCARCLTQTLICRRCDRGHQYCSFVCSSKAKRDSHRRANQKYAKTRKGKHHNAQRQRRYRARQSQKVTDQGSSERRPLVSSGKWMTSPTLMDVLALIRQPWYRICHFCFIRISDYIRNDFLHRQMSPPPW